MTLGGSLQLRTYRCARRTMSMTDAAEMAGIGLGEAQLIDQDDERTPPPPQAFEMITARSRVDQMSSTTSIAADELRLFIERVERLQEEQKGLADDIKEVFSEMKGRGYDTKIVRKLLAIRKRKAGEVAEERMILETYASAIGMQLNLF